MNRDASYYERLVRELIAIPRETEWLELKHNKDDPAEIGEYLSALANSAALFGKAWAYVLWGIDDQTHLMVGTTFDPVTRKIGNEELESWLLRQLTPKIEFRFRKVFIEGHSLVLLEIGRAFRHPVQFAGHEYVRVGTYKKKLKDFPEKERTLWRIFDATPFEALLAAENVSAQVVLDLIDHQAYFGLMTLAVPDQPDAVLQTLAMDRLVERSPDGGWNIRNKGAILFGRNLRDFTGLSRKAVRVIAYRGFSRVQTIREHEYTRGYAAGFEALIAHINSLLPRNEVIGQALRRMVPVYPELAIRELVANALVHQDLFVTGSGPMIEIFEDRMEVTNPGLPLVDTTRFLDHHLAPATRSWPISCVALVSAKSVEAASTRWSSRQSSSSYPLPPSRRPAIQPGRRFGPLGN